MGVNLIEKISDKEKEMIEAYIKDYAIRDNYLSEKRENFETIFTPWANEKGSLYKLLSNNLILSRSFTMDAGLDMISNEIFRLLNESDFISNYQRAISDNIGIFTQEFDVLYNEVIAEDNLISGYFNGDSFSLASPKIEFGHGEKIMKVIHKIANAFDIPGFEEFRIEHSRILNKKKFNNEITLSIHPLDYMTMSDNNCNWESCMSWKNDGCYRQGTVEMMNSPCVVVAYVNSSKKWDLFDSPSKDCLWSNKKWRCLFIITDKIICKVKSYPYQNESLEKTIIEWISELAEENWGISYDTTTIGWNGEDTIQLPHSEKKIIFYPDANYMYNDFGSGVIHWLRVNPEAIGEKRVYHLNYSGMSECMWCGDSIYCDEDQEVKLLCDDCIEVDYCYECDTEIYGDEIYTDDSGNKYCHYCYDNYTVEEDISGNIYNTSEMKKLYVVPSYEIIEKLRNKDKNIPSNRMGLIDYFRLCDCPYLMIKEDNLYCKENFENSILKRYFKFEDIHIIRQSWNRNYIIGEDCFNKLCVYMSQDQKDSVRKKLIDNVSCLFNYWVEEK